MIVKYTQEHLIKEYPGEITNTSLLKDFNKYLRDDDPNDITNFVIRNKCREGTDYKLVSKALWEKLHAKYGGLELKRYKDNDYYSRKFNIKFP